METGAGDIPIAVVGLGGVFPGASSPAALWENVVAGRSFLRPAPAGRWIVDPAKVVSGKPGPDKVPHSIGGYVEGFRLDAASLGLDIDTHLFDSLDPLFSFGLHASAQAFGDARMDAVDRRRIGVMMAAIALPSEGSSALTRSTIGERIRRSVFGEAAADATNTTNPLNAYVCGMPSALIANALGLGGGALTLDAACASSLYAIKLACDELRSGRCDAMIAGGLSRPDCLYTQMGFAQLRALSARGVCAPFDATSDGLIVGEGAGAVVLKRLDDAIAAGDRIYGVIRDVGLSNDIGGSLLAPDSEGQLRAMRQAYASAGWSPNEIDLVECHGTGTPIGDAVEVRSLIELWKGNTSRNGQCAIGSIKSMIGHLLTGAGAAGLIKTILALHHKTLPPSANYQDCGEVIPLRGSPFHVQQSAARWDRASERGTRKAAVSAFGFGGINAHVLLEEWDGGATYSIAPGAGRTASANRDANKRTSNLESVSDTRKLIDDPIAIVGVDARFGKLEGIAEFAAATFEGGDTFSYRGDERFRGLDDFLPEFAPSELRRGGFIDGVNVPVGEFKIPPNEIVEVLPQQLLMLKSVAAALDDACMPRRASRPNVGAIIGMAFDIETTNFQLRWWLKEVGPQWAEQLGISEETREAWTERLIETAQASLSAPGVVGNLGGMIASRIAREFSFGGPSFGVSSGETSALTALEIAVRSLRQGEIDACVVGGVDLACDGRTLFAAGVLGEWSSNSDVSNPLDVSSSGMLPGEGAGTVVLKRLSDAQRDGDFIYATINGIASANGGGLVNADESIEDRGATAAIKTALCDAIDESGAMPSNIGLLETAATGDVGFDDVERHVIANVFSGNEGAFASSAASGTVGVCGAATGMASLLRAILSLSERRIPIASNATVAAGHESLESTGAYMPIEPQYWYHDRASGLRNAAVIGRSRDGNVSAIVLGENPVAVGLKDTCEFDRDASRSDRFLDQSHADFKGRHGTRWFWPDHRSEQASLGSFVFAVTGNNVGELQSKLIELRTDLTTPSTDLLSLATKYAAWFVSNVESFTSVALVGGNTVELTHRIDIALSHLDSKPESPLTGRDGVYYDSNPVGRDGKVAFVYPGSGNQYIGMGRLLHAALAPLMSRIESRYELLASELMSKWVAPYRLDWRDGWKIDARDRLTADMRRVIFAQVTFGMVMHDLLGELGLRPDAAIGYSLGESTSLFATKTWPNADEMLRRMMASPLFLDELYGSRKTLQRAWGIDERSAAEWRTVILAKPAAEVRDAIEGLRYARLLIVNTPSECVVGGMPAELEEAARRLRCRAIPIDDVPTVHLDAVRVVEDAYHALHVMETRPQSEIDLYSCNLGRRYNVNQQAAADSITAQAVHGFDFTKVIESAYADGVRAFLEVGPQASCSRMIRKTLGDRKACVASASGRPEDELSAFVNFIASCCAARLPIRLDLLYPARTSTASNAMENKRIIHVPLGGPPADLSEFADDFRESVGDRSAERTDFDIEVSNISDFDENVFAQASDQMFDNDAEEYSREIDRVEFMGDIAVSASGESEFSADADSMMETFLSASRATAAAHQRFFDFAEAAREGLTFATEYQAELVQRALNGGEFSGEDFLIEDDRETASPLVEYSEFNESAFNRSDFEQSETSREDRDADYEIASERDGEFFDDRGIAIDAAHLAADRAAMFSRALCMEFAVGKLANVLGPMFESVDAYPVRVRLPASPLMLVDRILKVDGEMASLTSGRVVTEHDVYDGAWYLDGGCAPVCITVEAGQADLFLSSYLGIDLAVKGTRAYRLLDATVTFHRRLPEPGETIKYDIHIDRFVKQGETYLFFFRFDGTIDGETVLTMRNGCAGFFTDEEIANSGGIILTKEDTEPLPGVCDPSFEPLVPMARESYNNEQVSALRRGDLSGCFGPMFEDLGLVDPLRLPDGRMKLFDRVLELDPTGGRFGLGRIRAEADIHPDDWFLTCHFIDDMTMPGTLMYECCVHTLRFFLLRMGWVGESAGVSYQPMHGIPSALKCRGPVTQATKKVHYEVDIKEIGYGPEPYVIADALMLGDGRKIVQMLDMSLSIKGLSREMIEAVWQRKNVETSNHRHLETGRRVSLAHHEPETAFDIIDDQYDSFGDSPNPIRPAIYDKQSILAYSNGKPSDAFGEPYRIFDSERVIARLPGPPFQFLDRVVEVTDEPFVLKPTDWIETEYDVPADAWYFAANRQPTMPFAVILEAALQPCGWLAAYCGSALRSETDVSFRNLGGTATLYREVGPNVGKLTVRVRMTNVNQAGGMIVQDYDMQLSDRDGVVYEGKTTFGFFSKAALAQQVGVRDAALRRYQPTTQELQSAVAFEFDKLRPFEPDEIGGARLHDNAIAPGLRLPGRAFLMLERVDSLATSGGPNGLGFIRGSTSVDPAAWFFKAHFYQDPVWPGSLGLESFLQLIKSYILERWGDSIADTHRFEAIATGVEQTWVYRGQVIPTNKRVEVEAVITRIEDGDSPLVVANGFLVVDRIPIYEMNEFTVRAVRSEPRP